VESNESEAGGDGEGKKGNPKGKKPSVSFPLGYGLSLAKAAGWKSCMLAVES
jgi:hypothetical protein